MTAQVSTEDVLYIKKVYLVLENLGIGIRGEFRGYVGIHMGLPFLASPKSLIRSTFLP